MSGKTELRLFDEPLPQVVIDEGMFEDITPTTSIGDDKSTIEFLIHGSANEYLDLNDTILYIKLKVLGGHGANNLAANSNVTPVNYFMNALFSDITLTLNNTVIEGGNRTYAYKSTMDCIFNFSGTSKYFQLAPMGFNEDADERKKLITQSRECELVGALRLDFFNQPKYLLPGVNVSLKMSRAKDLFALTGGGQCNPLIKFLNMRLYVRRVRVNPSVMKAHEDGLTKRNAIYPYTRGEVTSYSVAQGSLAHVKDGLFSGSLLPKFLVVGFVKTTAFNGTGLVDSPFTFNDFTVSSIGLYRNGQLVPFSDMYEGKGMKEYLRSIVHNTQLLNTNFTNGISFAPFQNGPYTLFTFNLTPDFDMTHSQLPRDGNLRLEIKFRNPLAEPINVVIYGTFDSQIQITKNRQIICSHVH